MIFTFLLRWVFYVNLFAFFVLFNQLVAKCTVCKPLCCYISCAFSQLRPTRRWSRKFSLGNASKNELKTKFFDFMFWNELLYQFFFQRKVFRLRSGQINTRFDECQPESLALSKNHLEYLSRATVWSEYLINFTVLHKDYVIKKLLNTPSEVTQVTQTATQNYLRSQVNFVSIKLPQAARLKISWTKISV